MDLRLLKLAGSSQDSGMSESEGSPLVILLASCAGLLALVLFLIFRISGCLSRIESLLAHNGSPSESSESQASAAETSSGGAFEAFLSEDPSRREMAKGEQFSAYRRWRQEKGLNWSNS
jgi:hypothetical protein